jgi:hypothetical protein
MKKKIGLLVATIMVLNTVSSVTYGWQNPLKNYNLYEDTHPTNAQSEEKEQAMSEFYSNSMAAKKSSPSSSVPTSSLNYSSTVEDSSSAQTSSNEPRRNEILRESSRNVYGDPEVKAGWTTAQSFYSNPSLESIRAKYKKSNFAGCLQECISYVKLHPNDTLGFYYMAMCYTKVSDKENAIKAYEKVISLNANPMIVKYATNGRNCVLGEDKEKCYQNVNEPDLIYPYANIGNNVDLTPVDPNVLINRNLVNLQNKLSPQAVNENKDNKNGQNNGKDDDKNKINLPFATQDEQLDKFINAPYGNGLSPDLNKEYKQLQLRKIQESINTGDDSPEKDMNNVNDIKHFDKQSDSGTIKLAYVAPSDEMKKLSQDPEFTQSQRELDELRMLLGNDSNSKSSNDDLMNLVPYMSGQDKNLSPEVIQAMMIKSMMPDFTFVNSDSKNLL